MLQETIKQLRQAQGLTQEELAKRIHVVRQTVSKWETGLSVPDAEELVALAVALGTSAATLLGEPVPPDKPLPTSRIRHRRLRKLSWAALIAVALYAGAHIAADLYWFTRLGGWAGRVSLVAEPSGISLLRIALCLATVVLAVIGLRHTSAPDSQPKV